MGDAAKALKSVHKNMDVDDVHNLMDDVAEQQEIANEISEAISNPVGFGQDVDEVRKHPPTPPYPYYLSLLPLLMVLVPYRMN